MNKKNNLYKIETPFFALAPMAGISTYPFASQCANFGADIVWSPMIHTDALIYNPNLSLKIINQIDIKKYIVQLVGSEPKKFSKATKIINDNLSPIGIDINAGCPDKNTIKSGCGGALMKDPDLLFNIVKAVKNETKLPVSVKIRAGFDNHNDVFDIVKKIGDSISLLTVHPRKVTEMYKNNADWSLIKKLKNEINIPICGSGDIKNWQDAYDRIEETGCDGVMIGRGALGKPWIFKEIKDKNTYESNIDEVKKLTLDLAKNADNLWGDRGIRESRKHFAWYFNNFDNAKKYRSELMRADNLKDVVKILTM